MKEKTTWVFDVNEKGKLDFTLRRNGCESYPFVDVAWGLVFLKNEEDANVSKLYYSRNQKVDLFGPPITSFQFDCDNGLQGLTISIDEAIVQISQICRLSFYARTDEGTFLASFCPTVSEDARRFVLLTSSKKKINTVIQHMATTWLYEIYVNK